MPRLHDHDARRINDALIKHDAAVSEFERRWGVGRLPLVVSTDLRARYDAQCDRLDAAIEACDPDMVERMVGVSIRAYAALEQAARDAGVAELRGDYYEAAMPDGSALCVTRDIYEQVRVARERRDAIVWSVEEVARVVGSYEAAKAINRAKAAVPGATVERVTDRSEITDDDIPF